jgi:dienelactone hydrolase
MTSRLALSVVVACLAGTGVAAAEDDLARALAAAVDAETPAERAAAAEALAKRPGTTLDAWVAAAKALRPAATLEAGMRTHRVDLRVGAGREATEIVTYVPAAAAGAGPAPLLLALHGAGGRGGEMAEAWRGVADAVGAVVVAPTEAGPNEGYRFTPRERASALAALRWARRRFDVDEARVTVTGYSRGGHMTWDLALRHPDLFAAVVPVLGGPRLDPRRGENNLRFLENLVDVSIRDLQGAQDDPLLVANVRRAFERLAGWKARDAKLVEFPDRGHDADLSAVDWQTYLRAVRRDPAPARVVRLAASAGEGRAHGVEVLAVEPAVVVEPQTVQPAGWDRMDAEARRAHVARDVEKKTARLEVVRTAPGRFEAKSTGVTRFRLLLPAEALVPGKPVTVVWNGRTVTKPAAPSAAVLLRDFVERFDRTSLPVAEVTVP